MPPLDGVKTFARIVETDRPEVGETYLVPAVREVIPDYRYPPRRRTGRLRPRV